MILLFTDFGLGGPYVGQMHAVLAGAAPGIPVIDLMHDAPAHDPRRAAYLLAALAERVDPGAVCVGVVDPGVGGARPPLILEADGRWFIGPGNGLFELVRRRARRARHWRITWRPAHLSDTFHGRDLFAPVAAMIARGDPPPGEPVDIGAGEDWPDDLAEIVYIDGFGNAMTGLRADRIDPAAALTAGGVAIPPARTFAESAIGAPFWYGNSSGLAEIAVNQGSAAQRLKLAAGNPVAVSPSGTGALR
jgi:S-adenosylmethionine hydrolase